MKNSFFAVNFWVTFLMVCLTLLAAHHAEPGPTPVPEPGISVSPRQYEGAEFHYYVLTDLGMFAIYKASLHRINKEWRHRQSHAFTVYAFSDTRRWEVWYAEKWALEVELKNIGSIDAFREAIERDKEYEAAHRANELERWINE